MDSITRYGNGKQKTFEVPGSLLKVVYVGGVLTTPASSDFQSLTLTDAPAPGVPIEIEFGDLSVPTVEVRAVPEVMTGKITRLVSADRDVVADLKLIAPIFKYSERSSLRSFEGRTAQVIGLGLFTFMSGSNSADDDETTFSTANGAWCLSAVAPDYLAAQLMLVR
jgi:hypothetical protein